MRFVPLLVVVAVVPLGCRASRASLPLSPCLSDGGCEATGFVCGAKRLCVPVDGGSPEEGASDGGRVDAGPGHDGGFSILDAGQGGEDGSVLDAGEGADGGVVLDGGAGADGGPTRDAGDGMDGGQDAGTGSLNDAGQGTGSGADGGQGTGAGADGGQGTGSGADGGQGTGSGADGGQGTGSGADGGASGGGSSDAGLDAGPKVCLADGVTCNAAATPGCCSGDCAAQDGGGSLCAVAHYCAPPDARCTSSTDCCSNSCVGGLCQASCAVLGATCASPADCCSATCTGGTCQPIPASDGGCTTLGNGCGLGSQCCSTNCQSGSCVRASACNASGDICFSGADCCSALCGGAVDGGPGTCVTVTAPGAGGCAVDGEPCGLGDAGVQCCSRLCVDPGTGVLVCAPASGCRLIGDVCTENSDCCGGPPLDTQSTCSLVSTNPPVGRCTNPNGSGGGTGCDPVGDVCGVNARQDCCDGKTAVCKFDSEGIDRCFGGGKGTPDGGCSPTGYSSTNPGCCLAAGATCEFKDQCCGGAACLPTDDGGFVCAAAPTCLQAGTSCLAADGGCCTGLICAGAGALGDACQYPVISPDGGSGGSDGGSLLDGGTCSGDGIRCEAGGSCCSGYCLSGSCAAQSTCQPDGYACSSGADCCLGLSCTIPAGSISGTCQLGSTCASAGQACTETSGCCVPLSCTNAVSTSCDAGQACTCTGFF